jgi:hypothetical protein
VTRYHDGVHVHGSGFAFKRVCPVPQIDPARKKLDDPVIHDQVLDPGELGMKSKEVLAAALRVSGAALEPCRAELNLGKNQIFYLVAVGFGLKGFRFSQRPGLVQ